MKNQFRKPVIAISFVLAVGVPLITNAHTGYDPLHPAKVESISSRTAYPKNIHVEKTDIGIIVTGIIKRSRHNGLRLRGYVDVVMLDEKGSNIGSARHRLVKGNTTAHRNSFARFKIILPLPKSEKYSIKVSHLQR
jgi:hypothetical protein